MAHGLKRKDTPTQQPPLTGLPHFHTTPPAGYTRFLCSLQVERFKDGTPCWNTFSVLTSPDQPVADVAVCFTLLENAEFVHGTWCRIFNEPADKDALWAWLAEQAQAYAIAGQQCPGPAQGKSTIHITTNEAAPALAVAA